MKADHLFDRVDNTPEQIKNWTCTIFNAAHLRAFWRWDAIEHNVLKHITCSKAHIPITYQTGELQMGFHIFKKLFIVAI